MFAVDKLLVRVVELSLVLVMAVEVPVSIVIGHKVVGFGGFVGLRVIEPLWPTVVKDVGRTVGRI